MKLMSNSEGRRHFLRAALSCAGASALGAALHAVPRTTIAQSTNEAIAETALRDDVIQISGAGGNVLLLTDSQGGVLIDSGAPESAGALFERVAARLGGRTVDVLFNTHWHLDHTGGNEAFAETGAKIIAHENTRLWMGTEYYVDWQDRTYAPRPASALPTETFYSHDPQPIELPRGLEKIRYGHLREAHTDGDIFVWLREHNVLAVGGAVSAGEYPILDYATGGWIGGLMDATAKLLAMADADTLIVPARGPAQRREFLMRQQEMIATVRGRVEDLMRKGKSAAEMIAADVTREFDDDFGTNRARFIENVYGGLWWQGRLTGSL
jgi:glyoxylase-like metal-dependent hydrolase (beta-lactamase superfamily II)